MTDEEQSLLDAYRALDGRGRRTLLARAISMQDDALAQARKHLTLIVGGPHSTTNGLRHLDAGLSQNLTPPVVVGAAV